MQAYSSTSITSTSENTSDITMLAELPPGSNEILRSLFLSQIEEAHIKKCLSQFK